MKDWPTVTEISVGNSYSLMISTILSQSFGSAFPKMLPKNIHEEGQMDPTKLTFLGLKVTERQFTHSIK